LVDMSDTRKKTTSITLTQSLRARIDEYADELGESRTAFIETACIQRLERLRAEDIHSSESNEGGS